MTEKEIEKKLLEIFPERILNDFSKKIPNVLEYLSMENFIKYYVELLKRKEIL